MTKIEKSPSMPFYGKDAYDDEKFASLSYGAQGFFWRLAWWQWSEGSIPAQIDVIISLRGKEKESRRLWAEVAPMFPSSNGGERRQNAYVEQLRAKLVSVRAKRQQAAYKRHANSDFCTPNSVFLHTLPHEEEKEDANVKDVQSICDEFISRPEPHPSELLVAVWLRKVSVTSLREILNRDVDVSGKQDAEEISARLLCLRAEHVERGRNLRGRGGDLLRALCAPAECASDGINRDLGCTEARK